MANQGIIETFANNQSTTLSSGMDNSQTTVPLTATIGPSTANAMFRILIDAELMLVIGGQGTSTLTVIRGIESTSTVSHSSGATVTQIVTAAALHNLRSRDVLYYPTSLNTYGLDDEFTSGSLDGSWSQVDGGSTSANVTWTIGNEVLSVSHINTCNVNIHAKVKALGSVSTPVTVQMGIRYFTPYATNYLMAGPIMADGNTAGAGKQIFVMDYTNTALATAVSLSTRSYNNYTTETATLVQGANWQWMGSVIHKRLIWASANTFHVDISGDGVSWYRYGSSLNYVMTPTYAGFAISNYGATATQQMATLEYFRVF